MSPSSSRSGVGWGLEGVLDESGIAAGGRWVGLDRGGWVGLDLAIGKSRGDGGSIMLGRSLMGKTGWSRKKLGGPGRGCEGREEPTVYPLFCPFLSSHLSFHLFSLIPFFALLFLSSLSSVFSFHTVLNLKGCKLSL